MPDRIPLVPVASPAPTQAPRWEDVAARLRDYAAARGIRGAADEKCEFCGVEIDAVQHGHLVDVSQRRLLCVCRPCYLLFTQDGAGGARFRAVPDRYVQVPEFASAPELWDALQLPSGLAFFFTSSGNDRTTAFYPSPAGATESELPLEAWAEVVRAVPQLESLTPDVEALLVRRTEFRADALIVPIDACYELVGRIRRNWRGFSGGDEVWREIDEFFARATERAGAAVS